ncbi:hypothetical protein LZ554_009280 [Drepanopeziza brunnea f. sp. 'monogermtubi']|nr:hypothetical protein LZ554_009280 [Drepanopeziza brunnea f. sp. 'monogermtubi']
MAEPTEDVLVKVATNAAEDFVKSFYSTLSNETGKLSGFYIKPSPSHPLKPKITINGNLVKDPETFEATLNKQKERPSYDYNSFDAHPLNHNFNVGADDTAPDKDGKKMSIAVMCSGNVKYTLEGGIETHSFSESFVLVPNWDTHKPNAARGLKNWLIASQNFRHIS